MKLLYLLPLGVALAAITTPARAVDDLAQAEHFETHVRPILAEHCFRCHGADKQKASLRLDHIQAINAGGDSGAVLSPGDPDASRLFEAVTYSNVDLQMPPKDKLSDEAIETLRAWIADGAYWPDEPYNESGTAEDTFDVMAMKEQHWAWEPIADAAPPAVQQADWPSSDTDRFILARLEEEGFAPAPEAEPATLLRRLYFDLVGIPPTPEELQAFLADPSPEAYEREVDKLLASNKFGERWGRHWLDITRYADTYGHEQDYPIRHAWQYRDYVIRAINSDVPYDQFVKEHIAGDLMPEPRRHSKAGFNESELGTGFYFLHQATHAPVDVRKDQADRIDNQIDVLSRGFLGMTIACARCHDHKFDAISAKDYYALAGFMRSTRQLENFIDPQGRVAEKAEELREQFDRGERLLRQAFHGVSQDGPDFAPYMTAAADVLALELDAAKEKTAIRRIAREQELNMSQLKRWVAALSDEKLAQPSHPMHLWQSAMNDGVWDSTRKRAADDTSPDYDYVLYEDFDSPDSLGEWQFIGQAFEHLPEGQVGWSVSGGKARLSEAGVVHSGLGGRKLQGVFRSPDFTLEHDSIHVRMAGRDGDVRLVIEEYQLREFNGLLFGDTLYAPSSDNEFHWFHMVNGLSKFKGRKAYLEFRDQGRGWVAVDEIRFSNAKPVTTEREELNRLLLSKTLEADLPSLAAAYQQVTKESAAAWAEGTATNDQTVLLDWLHGHGLLDLGTSASRIGRLVANIAEFQEKFPAPMRAHVAAEGTPKNEVVHLRGNYKMAGDEVPRRFLEAMGGEVLARDEGSGRLALAERIFEDDNPLPARVMVNRVWHHLFGRGIVKSVDNFGVLGFKPSHPELLDHLAAEFREDDWSVKRLIRRLVTTSTYRMTSRHVNPQAEELDPDNILLHRMNRRRLQGEAVRDTILAVAGTLDDKMYGTPVPAYISPFAEGNRRPAKSGPMDGDRRRSIYLEVRRNYLDPLLLAFDLPTPDTTHGRRSSSNVPAQALILMNSPFVIEQAAALGEQIAGIEGMSFDQRLSELFWRTLGRAPTADETNRMRQYAESFEAASPQLWADLSHVAFTLKEFIFIS